MPLRKFLRLDVLRHFHVPLGRTHVLAKCHDIDVGAAQITQGLLDFRVRLATAQHDAGFGHEIGAHSLGVLQCRETLAVLGAAVTYKGRRALDRLNVVGIHIQATERDLLHTGLRAAKVRHEGLDQHRARLLLDFLDRKRNVRRTTVGEVVTVDRRKHNIAETPPRNGLGRVLWLMRVQRRGLSRRLDGAEAARTCACIAHQHDRRGSGLLPAFTAPALANVGAPRLLTDRSEAQATQIALDTRKVRTLRNARLGIRR